jgi:hypothetical protein
VARRFPEGFEERACGLDLELAAYTDAQPPPGSVVDGRRARLGGPLARVSPGCARRTTLDRAAVAAAAA